MTNSARPRWWWFLIVLSVFVGFSAMQWNEPAIEDEILLQKCKPIWFERGADWCELVHTPLYHEATNLWQGIWGVAHLESPHSMAILRSFGTFMALVASVLMAFFMKARLSSLHFLLWCIFLFHPYWIQGSLELHYDTTVLVVPLLLATWSIERSLGGSRRQTLLASVSLGLALFAKELTPLIWIFLWPLFALFVPLPSTLKRSRTAFVLEALGGALGGAVVGIALLNIWAWAHRDLGFHWFDPLLLSYHKFFGRAETGGFLPWKSWGWSRFLFLNLVPFLWLLPSTAALVFLGSRSFRGELPRDLKSNLFKCGAVVVTFLAYGWLVQAGYYFPSYTFITWPLLAWGLAERLPQSQPLSVPSPPPAETGLILGLGLFGLWSYLDPLNLISLRRSLFSTPSVSTESILLWCQIVLGWILPLLAFWTLARRLPRGPARPLALLLFGALAYQLGVDLRHLSWKDTQKRYLYGEVGFSQTLAQIRSRLEELKSIRGVSASQPLKVFTPTRDLHWALSPWAQAQGIQLEATVWPHPYVEETVSESSRIWEGANMVFSRTYGEFSIRQHPELLRWVERTFPHHEASASASAPYEWWWKP